MYTFYLEGSIDWTLLRLDFRSIINFMSRAMQKFRLILKNMGINYFTLHFNRSFKKIIFNPYIHLCLVCYRAN